MAWEPDDQDKALAWQQIEDDRCPGCGNPMSETTDHELRGSWEAEKIGCAACRVKDAKAEDARPGEFVIVTRRL